MKKSIFVLCTVLFCNIVFAQKGDSSKIVAGVNIDVGAYGTETYNKTFHTTDQDGAVSSIKSIWGEYVIKRRVGVGLKIAGANYVSSKDSNTNTVPTVKSFDFGLTVNYYLINNKKFCLPAGITFGTSSFSYKLNDPAKSTATDQGSFFNIGIYPRFYFGNKKKFGMNFKLVYAAYAYNSMDYKSNYFTFNDASTLKGKGINIGFGLQYRIK